MDPVLVSLAIKEAPAVIALLKDAFAKKNPDAEPPTDEQVIAAYNSAFKSSLAIDDAYLAEHPGAAPAPPADPA